LRVTAETIQEKLEQLENTDEENPVETKISPSTLQICKHFSVPKNRRKMERMLRAFNFMEDYSFFIFALLFLVFNISYWTWLLSSSGYFDWDPNSEHNPKEL